MDFLQTLEKYSLIGAISLIVIYFASKALSETFTKIFDIWINKWRTRQDKKSGLLTHSFFSEIRVDIQYTIPHLPINDKLRAAIFKDLLLLKFGVFHNRLQEFIKAGDLNKLSQDDFTQKVDELLLSCIDNYESKARQIGIPPVAIERFAQWHAPAVESTATKFHTLTTSEWRDSNTAVMRRLLALLEAALGETIEHAKNTIDSLNGELDEVEYKGIRSSKKGLKHHHEGCGDSNV